MDDLILTPGWILIHFTETRIQLGRTVRLPWGMPRDSRCGGVCVWGGGWEEVCRCTTKSTSLDCSCLKLMQLITPLLVIGLTPPNVCFFWGGEKFPVIQVTFKRLCICFYEYPLECRNWAELPDRPNCSLPFWCRIVTWKLNPQGCRWRISSHPSLCPFGASSVHLVPKRYIIRIIIEIDWVALLEGKKSILQATHFIKNTGKNPHHI